MKRPFLEKIISIIQFNPTFQRKFNFINSNMGNKNSLNTQSELPINFTQIRRQTHPILGETKHILNIHDSSQYFLIEKVFASSAQYEICLKNVKGRSKISKMKQKYQPNQFIIEIIDYRTAECTEFCGKTFKIFIFIKAFEFNLKQLFQQRQKAKQQFSEKQLCEMILNVVNCLIQLYDHNIRPFHLSMQNIVWRNNKIKLIDCLLSNQMSPIDSLNYRAEVRKGTFIAPEILCQNYECSSNSSKSDIFTLGMIVLEMVYLKNYDQIYDYSNKKINFAKIQALTSKLNFTKDFNTLLIQMLQECPEQRIGILRLKQSLTIMNRLSNVTQHNYKLGESLIKPIPSDKGLIYLGRNPHVVKCQNFQKQTLQTKKNHKNKNSYHRLLNQKVQTRNKKAVSFKGKFSERQKIVNYSNIDIIAQRIVKQTPQTDITITAQNFKVCQTVRNDLQDDQSDVPISPISIHRNQTKSEFDPWIFRAQDKIAAFTSLNGHNKITQIKNDTLNYLPFHQIYYKNPNYHDQNQTTNKIIQPKDQTELVYAGADFKISQFPSFSLAECPTIQQIQTPRIPRYSEASLKQFKARINSPKKNEFPEETPIKSLELIRTSRRQNNNTSYNRNTKYQKEKTFGRYDFSNGAVYEGEFNTDNEFQGNGVLYFNNGKVFYSGCWKKNQFHGFGILNNIESFNESLGANVIINYKNFNFNDNFLWSQYEGQFYEDKKHGFGTLYFVNGDKFSGCFVNDSIEGFGNFFIKSSQRNVMGIWDNNLYRES